MKYVCVASHYAPPCWKPSINLLFGACIMSVYILNGLLMLTKVSSNKLWWLPADHGFKQHCCKAPNHKKLFNYVWLSFGHFSIFTFFCPPVTCHILWFSTVNIKSRFRFLAMCRLCSETGCLMFQFVMFQVVYLFKHVFDGWSFSWPFYKQLK